MICLGTKVKDMTAEELRSLITNTVKETMEDIVEDIIAVSSENYLKSIEAARKDYKENKVKDFEAVFNV